MKQFKYHNKIIRVKIFILDMTKILTIDQGTTSSRSIVFDSNANIVEASQKEYPLIYPKDGWVEIDPEVLIKSVTDTLGKVNLDDIASAAITNQRETTIVWERDTGKPIYNAIVWQDRRTKDFCSSIDDKEILKEVEVEKIIYQEVVKPEPVEIPVFVQVPVPTDPKDLPKMEELTKEKIKPISAIGGLN